MCSNSPRPEGRSAGVTLIELLIVLSVLAVLVAMAAPNFREISTNSRSTSQVNTLLADLAMARSEAVKRARTVSVRASGAGWSEGWLVFVDMNATGVLAPGDGDEVLKQGEPVNLTGVPETRRFNLRAVSGISGAGDAAPVFTFGASGQARTPAAGGRFALCRPDNDASKSRGIRVDVSGRTQSVRTLEGLGMTCP